MQLDSERCQLCCRLSNIFIVKSLLEKKSDFKFELKAEWYVIFMSLVATRGH